MKILRKLLSELKREEGAVQRSPSDDTEKAPYQKNQTHHAAVLSLVDHGLVKSKVHTSRVHKVPWDKSHPFIVDFYRRFQDELEFRGMPFYAHCFYRDNETQYDLFRKGRTKARPGTSPHNFGMAVDIVHSGRHWDLTSKEWAVIGAIGKEVARKAKLKVVWGGDWSFYDPAHWELSDWRKRRDAGEHLHGWTRQHYAPSYVSKMPRKVLGS